MMLYTNYLAFSQLFDALPVTVVTKNTLVPILTACVRMRIDNKPFVDAMLQRVV